MIKINIWYTLNNKIKQIYVKSKYFQSLSIIDIKYLWNINIIFTNLYIYIFLCK